MKKPALSLFAVLIFQLTCRQLFAQTPAWQWFDPATSSVPVIEGRGWDMVQGVDTNNFYGRLPLRAKNMVRPAVWNLSRNCAGEYIDCKTSATTIIIRYTVTGNLSLPHMPSTGVSGTDLYARDVNGGWKWARGVYHFGDTIEYRFDNLSLSAKEEEFRIYLPLYNTVSWMNIGVPAGATFSVFPVDRAAPIVLYGTSIMQGACATRPGLAWTNILGRKLDHPVINLGFSGNGQLEQPLIDLMNESDARLFVLDCMPNLVDKNKFSREEIRTRIVNAVKNLQVRHPATPILLAEHSCSVSASNMDTGLVNKYKTASDILAATFDEMKKEGIENIFLLTDQEIGFDGECTVDGTHPNDIGMMRYADAYESIIRKIIHEEKGSIGTTMPIRQRRDWRTYDFMERHAAVLKTIREKQPDVVVVGNSITHFWGGPPEASINRGIRSWNKYFQPLHTVNLGFGWDRIENVLWRVYHGEFDGYKAKKILLTIGTNNISSGNTDEEIVQGIKYLINAIVGRQPSARILLSGIYPRRDLEQRVATLNKSLAVLAKTIGVTYIDPGVVLLKPDKKIDEQLFSDGLHPNEQGYEKLGAALVGYLR
ncbi:MAG: SGNH/GDSL hydrolase family protein [Chitinophagaceae bacterium]|nr:SGNH/GDSL hydrolase family protein [Chitinophagaceae bacterium]